jgi:hypothetical protein
MDMLSSSSPEPAMRIRRSVPAKSMLLYRQNSANACPGCGKSHWLVGRVMAQCAFCETALPLASGWRFEGLTRV